MNKPKLRIFFTDFWYDFNPNQNLFINLLRNRFEVELSKDPDILIYSVYDFHHLNYNCPKIFYTAENARPDFRECDFAISFDYESYNGKNLRLPLYRWNGDLENLCNRKSAEEIIGEKKKFACMVVSNGSCKERNRFYELLSQYKQVDSGGKFRNNVGGPVTNKMDFIKDYKFVLAFENSSYPGYTTEKIIEPMFVNSLPIYWGNSQIEKDFNPSSIINVHSFSGFEAAIERIIEIDKDEELYKSYLTAPIFYNNEFPFHLTFQYFEDQLAQAVSKILNTKPVSSKLIYKPRALMNKIRKKAFSRFYGRPHFYY